MKKREPWRTPAGEKENERDISRCDGAATYNLQPRIRRRIAVFISFKGFGCFYNVSQGV